MKRHHTSLHKGWADKYPLESETRKDKFNSLVVTYRRAVTLMTTSMNPQEKATEASLRIAWILNKNKMPLDSSAVVKECILAASQAMCTDSITKQFEKLLLSNDTNTRRTEKLGKDIRKTLIDKLKTVEDISVCIDESVDNTDIPQLAIFVRFFDTDSRSFREELITLLPMLGKTTGEDIFRAVTSFFNANSIPLAKISSLVTDGAPAMVGNERGVAARLKAVCPHLLSYHCIIHNSVLCTKLKGEYNDVMNTVINIVNYLRGKSSLRHREFKAFLEENEANYANVPYHNAVRWLSKGNTLNVIWDVRESISAFLAASEQTPQVVGFTEFLSNEEEMESVAFLVDIFKHLNNLNKQLQGRNKIIADLRTQVKAFDAKLLLFRQDLSNGSLLQFPTLKQYREDNECQTALDDHIKFIDNLIIDFDGRFENFNNCDALLKLIKTPYIALPNGPWNQQIDQFLRSPNVAGFQLEVIELQTDDELKHMFDNSPSTEDFWIAVPDKFVLLKQLALKICGMFGSTWLCESVFSEMNVVKNKYRSKLTHEHLDQILRIATTGLQANFKELAQESRANFSH